MHIYKSWFRDIKRTVKRPRTVHSLGGNRSNRLIFGSHLDEEEAGRRRRMVVDVHGDQHAGGDDERHQEDAEDQPDVQRVST